jgi:hypothetical protein
VALLAAVVCVFAGLAGVGPAGAAAAGAAACSQNVAFGLIEATTAGCLNEVSPGQWQTTDRVSLNGVSVTPVSGTAFVLTAPTPTLPGGRISIRTTDLVIAGVTVARGTIDWNLPAGGKGDEKTVVSTGTVNGEKLFGFSISGSAEIRIGWDASNNLRYFKFLGNLALPSIFKNGPDQDAGGLTASVGVRVDAAGVHADNVKAEISNAYIGALQVKNLCLSYVGAGSTTTPCSPPAFGAEPFLTCTNPGNVSRWDGSAEIVLPTADRPAVGVWAGVQSGMFSYAGGQVTQLGNSVPIAQGVYLESVALAVCVTPPPLAFKGGAGINLGQTTKKGAPLTITGSLQYTDSRPWVLEARGNVQVFGRPVADGFVRYMSDGTIDFGFNANLDFTVASVSSSVAGWIEARKPLRFDVLGTGKVCLARVACSSGEVAVSSVALAGCFTLLNLPYPVIVKNSDWRWYAPWRVHIEIRYKRIRGGFGVRWPNGSPNLMGDSCDVGPYRAVRTAQGAATRVFRLSVARGTRVLSLQVRGLRAPPRLELIAPNGVRYRSPRAAAVIIPRRRVFVMDSLNSTTAVTIARPVAGVWTVRPIGGARLIGIRRASIDAPPTVLAAVSPGQFRRTLGYSFQPDPQHVTRFVEEGVKYEQELGAARGAPCPGTAKDRPRPLCGQIRFIPSPGPGGTRQIYAITTINGGITEKQLVATYRAPAEPEPSAVGKLIAERAGGEVRIAWSASNAPVRAAVPIFYNVAVNVSDGRRLLYVVSPNKRRVTIPNVAPGLRVTVRIAAVRSDCTHGAVRTVTLAAGRANAA